MLGQVCVYTPCAVASAGVRIWPLFLVHGWVQRSQICWWVTNVKARKKKQSFTQPESSNYVPCKDLLQSFVLPLQGLRSSLPDGRLFLHHAKQSIVQVYMKICILSEWIKMNKAVVFVLSGLTRLWHHSCSHTFIIVFMYLSTTATLPCTH